MSEVAAEILTLKETAKMLRVSPQTVTRMIDENELPAIKIRRRYRIWRKDVEKLMTA